jgi:tetratricopeptide (TPR) repeat protein
MITRRLAECVLAAMAAVMLGFPAATARADTGASTGEPARSEKLDAAAPAADGATQPGPAQDELEKLLNELSPEEIQKLVQQAVQARLEVERRQVIEEMREDLLNDDNDVDAAAKMLENQPKNTQRDNIDRIVRAFSQVNARFRKAHELLTAKKHDEAAETIKKDLNVQEATYLNAARYTLYARALAAEGKSYDAVDAYQKVLVVMADRISFAADAAMESARIYEKMGRFTYAMQMYEYAVTNYGLTLDSEALKEVDGKVKEYSAFATDPLGWASGMMGDVRKRLDALDSGKETQAKEDRIVAVITDLIKTAEEKQCGQGQCQQKPSPKSDGQCKGEGQAQGGKQGPPKGTQQPSNPARVSALVPGPVARPTKRSEVRDTAEIGDWANLPPRERQKLEQLRKKVMSERYRDIIRKYRTRIAERGLNE